jgi:hypothetical protein
LSSRVPPKASFPDEEPTLAGSGQVSGDIVAPRSPSNVDVEIDLGEDDTRLLVELMPDGRLRAPVQAARELLRDRLRKAEVLRTGPRWAVLRTLDAPARASSLPRAVEREVIAAGTLGEGGLSLIDFIGFLANGMHTGVITVASGDVERSAYFHKGDVVWASSTSPTDRLGEFLLQRGKITREQLQIAIRDGDRRIGRACVERGFLAAHDLYAIVQQQLTEIFDRMLATEQGIWFFSRMSANALGESQIHLSTQGLLVDALRRLDEMQIYRQRIRNADVLVQRVAHTGREPDNLLGEVDDNMRAAAIQLYRQLPGTATISELMRILGRNEFDVTRTVYHLLRKGLVEIVAQQETGPIPRRHAAISRTEAREVIGIYSMAIREMFDEVSRVGKAESLRSAANAFLRDESTQYAHLLRAATLGHDGALDEAAMLVALQGVALSSQELSDALSELLFFVLFQATEYLGRRRGDDLARRVKLILGMLAQAGSGGVSGA